MTKVLHALIRDRQDLQQPDLLFTCCKVDWLMWHDYPETRLLETS